MNSLKPKEKTKTGASRSKHMGSMSINRIPQTDPPVLPRLGNLLSLQFIVETIV